MAVRRTLAEQLRLYRRIVNQLRREARASRGIRITITDDDGRATRGMDRIFDGLGVTMRELPDVLRSVVPDIKAEHARNFDTEGANGRGTWAPLAPSTLADRRRKGYGPGPILHRSGALRRHVLATHANISRRGADAQLRIRPKKAVAGRDGSGRFKSVPKYDHLAKGGRHMPGRPMVTLGPTASRRVTSAIMRQLRDRAAANGWR